MYWREVNEQNLHEFKNTLNWKGTGTQDNPIIIDSLEGINEYLRFKDIKSHIIVKNITLIELYVNSCHNIIFQNCTVYYFWIEFCHDILVEDSTIVNFHVEFSKGNVFRKNKLHQNSWFNTITLETNGESGTTVFYHMNICFTIFFILIGIILYLFLGPGTVDNLSSFIIIILLIGPSFGGSLFFLIPALKFRKKRSIIEQKTHTTLENNDLVDLEELNKKYSAVYDI
jgi:hypothetical protein